MAKKKKFTSEELSRILTAHCNKKLYRYGGSGFSVGIFSKKNQLTTKYKEGGCINQIAYNECDSIDAAGLNDCAANWFDSHYDPKMSAEELISGLKERGLI